MDAALSAPEKRGYGVCQPRQPGHNSERRRTRRKVYAETDGY